MNIFINKYQVTLLSMLLVSCSSSDVSDNKAFASDQDAAVHFLKTQFSTLDCEGIGVVTKGEVDEHFYDLFYAINKSRSMNIGRDELQSALYNTSGTQASYIFDLMDQDANSAVTTEEFHSFMFRVIDLSDTNNNGEVTLADIGLEAPRIIKAHDR